MVYFIQTWKRKMLDILITFQVSTATAERTFLSLRHIKTHLRSTTSENRLLDLALLSIHYNIPVDPNIIVTNFANNELYFIVNFFFL